MSVILDTYASLLRMNWTQMRKYFRFPTAPFTDKFRFASSCAGVIVVHLILLASKETSPAEEITETWLVFYLESQSGDDQIVHRRHS